MGNTSTDMDLKSHWANIYKTKASTKLSWYQEHPGLSLEFVQNIKAGLDAHIIDVGAGASTFVDHLILAGYHNITLLDISYEALEVVRNRIGEAHQKAINWIIGDITSVELPKHHYDIWHDRAVFHFLTDAHLRQIYVEQVKHAVKPNGHIIMASFAPDGPDKCSGLDVVRYDPTSLQHVFGTGFQLVFSISENHQTPSGSEQKFIYCYCRKQNISTE